MRSRYNIMSESTVKDIDGENFPDPISFPASRFIANDNTIFLNVNQKNIETPAKLMVRIYQTAEYDDIVFWLNDVDFIPDLEVESSVEFPTLRSLENFILKNRTN